ncbi:MAG: hypothetical protein IT189_11090 [Microbacteriaceae bacterium]|nr:hypothetical protein [Microbacteriaceae bacterium]
MRPRQRILGPTDSRAPQRRKAHGLTPAEVDALIVLQGGACAICKRIGEALQVDHDHRHCPGSQGCRRCVRGMLCGRCNNALGWIGDVNIPRLVAYVSR